MFTNKFKKGDIIKTVMAKNEYFYNKNGVVEGTTSCGENNEYGFKYLMKIEGVNQLIAFEEDKLKLA